MPQSTFPWRQEMNWQAEIVGRHNEAMHIRQTNPDGFKDAMAGVWNVLWPPLKEDLAKKVGDRKRNELFFDELIDEVLQIDLKEVLDGVPKRDKIIKACEFLNSKIQEVLAENKLLYGRGDMPEFTLRKRQLPRGGDGSP